MSNNHKVRLLIIRFSSFGDIVQALGAPVIFRKAFPDAEIDWLVREDFAGLIDSQPTVDRVISLQRKSGFFDLVQLAQKLANTPYTHIYDAHSSLRSKTLLIIYRMVRTIRRLRFRRESVSTKICVRSKNRFRRFLFFRFHADVLPRPFRGAESFLWPLQKWGLRDEIPRHPVFQATATLSKEVQARIDALPRPRVALAPSAAWPMKRWPIESWAKLIDNLKHVQFILLGGPEDTFLKDLENLAPGRVCNLAGQISLVDNSAVLSQADLVIAGDTGLLHLADQMERPTLALIGPTAFGYPSHASSKVLEVDLPCKPCSKDGRGGCRNKIYQKCLKDLTAENVAGEVLKALSLNLVPHKW